MKAKNVCFMLGNSQGNGGIARVVSIIANELQKYANIFILSYSPAVECAGYEYNKNITQVMLFDERISMTKALISRGAVKKTKKFLEINEIDILVGCGAIFFPLTILSTLGKKTKCFCWEHSDPLGQHDNKFQISSRRLASLFADNIIVLTKEAQKQYKLKYKTKDKKIVQIYNPVDPRVIGLNKYNDKSVKILSVGRLTYQKNFQRLLEIASHVLFKESDWTWEICGEGEDHKELEQLIKNKQLEDKVILRGQVKNLYQEYNQYAFLVMTSRYEGFPMSLIEASANSLPMVAFDVPTGPSEIILNGDNGFLISENDNTDMENKISRLMNDANQRIGMANKAKESSNRFEIQCIISQWRKLCGV